MAEKAGAEQQIGQGDATSGVQCPLGGLCLGGICEGPSPTFAPGTGGIVYFSNGVHVVGSHVTEVCSYPAGREAAKSGA